MRAPATIGGVNSASGGLLLTNPPARGALAGVLVLFLLIGLATAAAPDGTVVGGAVIAAGAAMLLWRLRRFGLEATNEGLVIRNLARTYSLTWNEVSDVRVETNSNVTGRALCLMVYRVHGKRIASMGTSSLNRQKVEAMLSQLMELRPST